MNPLLQNFEMMDDAMADIFAAKNRSSTVMHRGRYVAIGPSAPARSDLNRTPRLDGGANEPRNRLPHQSRRGAMNHSDMLPHQLMQRMADFFAAEGITYRVVGSLTSMMYGEPRFTNDVDIVATFLPPKSPTFAGILRSTSITFPNLQSR